VGCCVPVSCSRRLGASRRSRACKCLLHACVFSYVARSVGVFLTVLCVHDCSTQTARLSISSHTHRTMAHRRRNGRRGKPAGGVDGAMQALKALSIDSVPSLEQAKFKVLLKLLNSCTGKRVVFVEVRSSRGSEFRPGRFHHCTVTFLVLTTAVAVIFVPAFSVTAQERRCASDAVVDGPRLCLWTRHRRKLGECQQSDGRL